MTLWRALGLGLTILLVAGCGEGSGDAESQAADNASTVGGEAEITRGEITGPGPKLIAEWLTSEKRTGGVRLVPIGWRVTEIEITEWVNDGDTVDPFIRGNFEGGAALNNNGTWKHGSKILTNAEKLFVTEVLGWPLP